VLFWGIYFETVYANVQKFRTSRLIQKKLNTIDPLYESCLYVQKPAFMLTIDVEDWFHLVGAGLDYQFTNGSDATAAWETFPSRLEKTIPWILDQLDQHNRKATFFVLGWVAQRHPELIREIDRRGHELASHSYWHRIVYQQSQEEFRADLVASKQALEDGIGKPLVGFRASTASITDWAVEILAEEGFRYDASFFPAAYHDVYGRLSGMEMDDLICRHPSGVLEVKFSCLKLFGKRLPWSGGGYFRLLPLWLFELGIRRILRGGQPFMFFTHPWELDPNAPRLKSLKKRYAWRRYTGLKSARSRFLNLLKKNETTRIDTYLIAKGLL
jgi:polysaccharide deacetylase family protein (PEP-CTERM system associated)